MMTILVDAIRAFHPDTYPGLDGEEKYASVADAYPAIRWSGPPDDSGLATSLKTPPLTLQQVEAAVAAYRAEGRKAPPTLEARLDRLTSLVEQLIAKQEASNAKG